MIRRLIVGIGLFAAVSAFAQTPLGSAFVYQGRLEDGGAAADGPYDLEFRLFNLAMVGAQVGPTLCRDNVDVVEGVFSVALDFGITPFDGDARWLQVGVRAGGAAGNCDSGVYTPLSPRQAVSATPYALRALEVDGIDGHSLDAADGNPTNALVVDSAGEVGIGVLSPEARLHVLDGSAGSVTANSNSGLVVERSTTNYVSILSPADVERGILLGEPGSSAAGGIIYNNVASPGGMQFRTGGNSTKATLTASGDLGLGTSTPTARLHVAGDLKVSTLAGDAAVALPNGAISAAETGEEPALASDFRESATTVTPDGQVLLTSRTISAPSDGFVVAIGTARFGSGIFLGAAQPSLTIDKVTAPVASTNGFSSIIGASSAVTISMHAVFAVSAGENTFELRAISFANATTVSSRRLTLLYFPTSYGTVDVED